jgi:hypothetical protein
MKRYMLAYKLVALGLALFLSGTTISGAEYRGDQSRSPFMRFLHNLFWGGSGTASNFNRQSQGQTYRFSALSQGSSKTGARLSSGSSSQQDIWADYGKENSSVVATRKPISGRVASSGRVAAGSVSASSQTDGYLSPLTAAAAVSSSTSSSTAVSSSFAEATSVGMPSLLAFQTTKQALATTTASKESQATTDDDGWGDDPAEPMPVGDGTMTMIILAALYVYFNRKRFALQVNPI